MKEWRGLWFPDDETHLIEWMTTVGETRDGKPTYQEHKYNAALWYRNRQHRRVAIDVGANIGLWSRLMALDFTELHAFEPVASYAECWRCNVSRGTLHQMALGEHMGRAKMVAMTPGSCGDTTIDVGQSGKEVGLAEVRTLDSFTFENVDLIKCDNEGFELYVMRGAADTIKRCKPVVIVEQKPGHGAKFGISDTAAVDFLQGLGMTIEEVMSGDYVMSFR